MELCMATCYFYDSSPEEMLKHFAAVKCKNIELSTEHSEDLVNRGDLEKTAIKFKSQADNLGINIPQGHLLININLTAEDQKEVIDIMKRWLELYLALGIKQAVIHPGGRNLMKEGCDPNSINEKRANTFISAVSCTIKTVLIRHYQ